MPVIDTYNHQQCEVARIEDENEEARCQALAEEGKTFSNIDDLMADLNA